MKTDTPLELSEAYTCLTIAHGQTLIGLDLEDRIPADAQFRQDLYDEGAARLQQRGLLRIKRSGEAQLEQGLHNAMLAMSAPDLIVLSFVTVRDQGGFRLVHYYRDGEIWRAAISADNRYLLRSIPETSEMALELAAAACTGAELQAEHAGRVALHPLLKLIRRQMTGESVDSQLLDTLNGDPGLVQSLTDSLQQLERYTTISLIQPTSQGTRTHELLFLRTIKNCWIILQDNDSESVVSTIDQAQASDLLTSLFAQLID